MSTGKADKSLKLTQYLSVSLCVRRPHHWLTSAVFVRVVTERNVCWWTVLWSGFVGELYCGQGLLVNCTVVRVCWWTVLWSRFQAFLNVTPCSLESVYRRLERWWCLRNCAEHSPDDTASHPISVKSFTQLRPSINPTLVRTSGLRADPYPWSRGRG